MDKLGSMLSLAKKAGKLALGYDPAKEMLEKKKARLMLCAKDLSPKTFGKIALACEKEQVKVCLLPFRMDELWFIIGKRSGIVAVCDEGFARGLVQLTERPKEEAK